MATAVRKIESENFMSEQPVLEEKVANLKEAVADLKIEVTGIKADIRRVDAKIDGVKESLATLRNEMIASHGALRLEMREYFDRFRSDRKAMIFWSVSTTIAAAGLAFTAARFFSHA